MNLKIEDLIPHEAELKLSTIETPLKLRPWSIRVRIWAQKKYTPEGLQEILKTQEIEALSDIAFFMLQPESKALFKDLEDFQEHILSSKDIINLSFALFETIGLSEPVVQALVEEQAKKNNTVVMHEKKKSPKK